MQNAPSPRGLVGLLKMPEINEGVAADAYRSAEVWAPKTASQTDRYGIWCMVYGIWRWSRANMLAKASENYRGQSAKRANCSAAASILKSPKAESPKSANRTHN